jgi:hypothetical protein
MKSLIGDISARLGFQKESCKNGLRHPPVSTNISHDAEQATYEKLALVKPRAGSSVVLVETFCTYTEHRHSVETCVGGLVDGKARGVPAKILGA